MKENRKAIWMCGRWLQSMVQTVWGQDGTVHL